MNFMRHPGQRQTSPWAGERCLRTVVEGYLDAGVGVCFDRLSMTRLLFMSPRTCLPELQRRQAWYAHLLNASARSPSDINGSM